MWALDITVYRKCPIALKENALRPGTLCPWRHILVTTPVISILPVKLFRMKCPHWLEPEKNESEKRLVILKFLSVGSVSVRECCCHWAACTRCQLAKPEWLRLSCENTVEFQCNCFLSKSTETFTCGWTVSFLPLISITFTVNLTYDPQSLT